MTNAGTQDSDVVVIGGGPAGSTVARLLVTLGHRVVLLARPPAKQSLAESIPPSCIKLFDRIGARKALDAPEFIRSTGNTVWWGGGLARVERFAAGSLGYQVPRAAFDRVMLAEAVAAGVRVHRATVVDVAPGSDDRTRSVHFEADEGRRVVDASWVLDCTGRTGLLARRGWRRAESGGRTLALAAAWERPSGWGLDDETHTLVESYEGGWAWSVPLSTTRRFVTVMVDPTLTGVGGRELLTATYHAELGQTVHLRRLANGAHLVEQPFARDASPYSATRTGEDGLLLVGDAASFVDPLSSFGIKKALASAWLASIVVHTALNDAKMIEPALSLYETRERAMYDALQRRFSMLSREAADVHATDFWHDRAGADDHDTVGEPDVAALRADPEVLAAFAALKGRESIQLRQAAALRRVEKPAVRGNCVVLETQLAAPAFREGVRFIRGVDLVRLSELAADHDQVPDLYAAYNRSASPASLPDFLGALSVMIAKGMLVLA